MCEEKKSTPVPLVFIVFMIAALFLSHPVRAASFDCAKAATPQEKLICFDYRLSDLDSQLAWTYAEALKQTKNPVALKQSQKGWVAAREKCTDVNCILHAYVERIEALVLGSKLAEVYFPKATIPWDFSPQSEYVVSSSAKIKEKKLIFITYLKDTLTHGEDLIIPKDEYGLAVNNSEQENLNRLQNVLASSVNSQFEIISGKFTELGSMHMAVVATSYGECDGGLGVNGFYVARNAPWAKNNVLVPVRPHDWTVWKRSDDACYEAQLKIDPTIMNAVVFNQSLYLNEYHGDGDYVIRFDHNLQTSSTLLGKKIYLGWGSDLEALTGKACNKFVNSSIADLKGYSTKHRICIDEQLQKLIGEVGRFYN